jgi:hypothetical protein
MNGVTFSLCSIKDHTIKICVGVEISLHAFLTSAPDESDSLASCPGGLSPLYITGWVRPRTGLDAEEKKIS